MITTNNSTTNFAYDFENHLTQVTFPDTTTESYKYNGDGLRVSKRRDTGPSGIEISYILSGSDVIRETSAVWGNPPPPATPTTDYIFAGSMEGPLGFKLPGNPNPIYHYTHSDAQGSVMGLTDDSGTITDQYQYDAWGGMAQLPNPPPNQTYNPYHYTGQQVDQSTGFYYLRNRYYDAQAGRFTTEDPIGFDGGLNFYVYVDSVGKPFNETNLYQYARNNPVNFVDPSGKNPLIYAAILLGAAAVWAATGVAGTFGTPSHTDPPYCPGYQATTWAQYTLGSAGSGMTWEEYKASQDIPQGAFWLPLPAPSGTKNLPGRDYRDAAKESYPSFSGAPKTGNLKSVTGETLENPFTKGKGCSK
ncbi:MAG: hypothetical protein M1536_03830 [Firmicutes bacterium]|nr:hypothetical protein [Bacillota bacterium]